MRCKQFSPDVSFRHFDLDESTMPNKAELSFSDKRDVYIKPVNLFTLKTSQQMFKNSKCSLK